MDEEFVIPTSLIGQPVGISSATVRHIVRRLEEAGEIRVMRTPTGRGRLTVRGYQRVRKAFDEMNAQ